MQESFAAAATQLLGPRGWTADPDLVDPWLTDWRGRFHGASCGLASPADTGEVAAFVKLCEAHGVGIVPQGGNSGMVGGATPDESGRQVLLSLRRMNAIRSFDKSAQQVVCDAGVILQTLHERAEANGLRFPLTLGGKGSATVGGLISTNAGGTQVIRHGTMRAQVLGLEAVLADGAVFDGLAVLKKDNRGFDLKQLLIGSEGTLGIVTAATLQLLPQIADRRVIWAGLPSISAARSLLEFLQLHVASDLEGFEVMPDHCLQSVLEHMPETRSPLSGSHAWHALIELVAQSKDADQLQDRAEQALTNALEHDLLEDAVISATETQAEAFWLLRDSIPHAERALGPAMQHDISVPVSQMAQFVTEAVPQVEAAFAGTRAVAFGHLGDGNVHFHVLAPGDATPGEWEKSEGKAISAFVHDLVTRWDGSISAEHGIGQLKRDELERLGDPVSLHIMRAVKQAMDPQGILNPGKLVPLAPQATSP